MKRFLIASIGLVVLCTASMIRAQEQIEFPKPQKEHEWLQQFVGEWETDSEGVASPDGPTLKCTGTMKARMLGSFWAVSEYDNNVMGTTINAIQTVGFDPEKKKYVGTWVDSAMHHMWKYEGTVDESGKNLTLEAEGPSFTA